MRSVDADLIRELRQRTGAGYLECKKVLEETGGDMEKAISQLRVRGAAKAEKKILREVKEGTVAAYVHFGGGRLGSLVEVDCESDFVARNEEFQQLAREIAMQIAAYGARYISEEEVPPEVIEREKEIYAEQARREGRPDNVIPKIVEGKLQQFYRENCLLSQPYFRDGSRTVKDVLREAIAKFGENIIVRRFARFEVGKE
ncbi:MAG: translation elongation factor Ts [bacterium JZ-2024 1]